MPDERGKCIDGCIDYDGGGGGGSGGDDDGSGNENGIVMPWRIAFNVMENIENLSVDSFYSYLYILLLFVSLTMLCIRYTAGMQIKLN